MEGREGKKESERDTTYTYMYYNLLLIISVMLVFLTTCFLSYSSSNSMWSGLVQAIQSTYSMLLYIYIHAL